MNLTIAGDLSQRFRIVELSAWDLSNADLARFRAGGQLDCGRRQHLSPVPIAELCNRCRKCADHCTCEDGFVPHPVGKCAVDHCSSTIEFQNPADAYRAADAYISDEARQGRVHKLVEIDRRVPCV